MARDDSRPPRPRREGFGPRDYSQKTPGRWERGPQGDRSDRPFSKPFRERREPGPGYSSAPRPPFRPHDDELFAAKDKVASIVGPDPQSRYDMLRKMWDFFRAEGLIVPAGRRVSADANDWRDASERPAPRPEGERPERPRYNDDRPPRPRYDDARPERPRFREDRPDRPRYGAPRDDRPRYGPPRDDRPRYGPPRDDRPRYGPPRDDRPRVPRKPAGEHPAAKRAREMESIPHRKYKETREERND